MKEEEISVEYSVEKYVLPSLCYYQFEEFETNNVKISRVKKFF